MNPTGRLRVMHLVPMLRCGGMEHGVVKLVNGLRADIDSAICSFHASDALRDSVLPGTPVIDLGKRDGNDLLAVGRLASLLRRWHPHIVHTHSWGTLCEGWIAGRLAGVPHFIHGEHGTLETRPRNIRIQRWLWQRADRVLAVSQRLAERMSGQIGVPVSKITTIANGVDLSRFLSVSGASPGAPSSARPLHVGTVGRLVPVKNHAGLLHAIAALRHDGRQVELTIVGEGEERPALESLAGEIGLAGCVHLPGHRPDVERALRDMDVFVLPSHSEGMSNTILEAMASGLPVIATRVGGADELVEDGKTGMLIPPGDTPSLAAALQRMMDEPAERRAFGNAGRLRAGRLFGVERMLDDYRHLYHSVTFESARARR